MLVKVLHVLVTTVVAQSSPRCTDRPTTRRSNALLDQIFKFLDFT